MSLRFASLGSGSSGNATVVSYTNSEGRTRALLVDCGFSAKETEHRLARLSIKPSDIDAVLVTHEHGDHIKGVSVFSRRYDLPVYMSEGTYVAAKLEALPNIRLVRADVTFKVGDVVVTPITVPHDAREPLQFVLSFNGLRLGILTDLGSVTETVIEAYSHCHALLLEANHDLEMLARGPYPPSVQQRISGPWGHLNNEQCRELLHALDNEQLRCLVVGHISQKNNDLPIVQHCIAEHIASIPDVYFASQDKGFDWLHVSG